MSRPQGLPALWTPAVRSRQTAPRTSERGGSPVLHAQEIPGAAGNGKRPDADHDHRKRTGGTAHTGIATLGLGGRVARAGACRSHRCQGQDTAAPPRRNLPRTGSKILCHLIGGPAWNPKTRRQGDAPNQAPRDPELEEYKRRHNLATVRCASCLSTLSTWGAD